MRTAILPLLLCVLAAAQTPLSRDVTKLIVVTTPSWDAVDGTLVRYQRTRGQWTRVGPTVPVVVGKKGMAWDPKLKRQKSGISSPVKHEGDNRSPAGIFALPNTFGFADGNGQARNYIALTPSTECVDDSKSSHYTQVLDRSKVSDVDWHSSEHMRSIEGYRWGAVVAYNTEQPVPGHGSCIFLHAWSGPGQGTAGCTAMPAPAAEQLVRWLASGRTLLVQMPEKEYRRLRETWGLP